MGKNKKKQKKIFIWLPLSLYGIDYHVLLLSTHLILWSEDGQWSRVLLLSTSHPGGTLGSYCDGFFFISSRYALMVRFCSMSFPRKYSTHTCEFIFIEFGPQGLQPSESSAEVGLECLQGWQSPGHFVDLPEGCGARKRPSQTGQGPTSQRACPGWAALGSNYKGKQLACN